MIVCQCKGVTEAAVRKAVRAGALSIGEIGFACLAGTECGACHEILEQILRSERLEQKPESGSFQRRFSSD
jgi:bacterioferritin-associated ferredoxin